MDLVEAVTVCMCADVRHPSTAAGGQNVEHRVLIKFHVNLPLPHLGECT